MTRHSSVASVRYSARLPRTAPNSSPTWVRRIRSRPGSWSPASPPTWVAVRIAVLTGDDVFARIDKSAPAWEDGEPLDTHGPLVSANAYLGVEQLLRAAPRSAICRMRLASDWRLFRRPTVQAGAQLSVRWLPARRGPRRRADHRQDRGPDVGHHRHGSRSLVGQSTFVNSSNPVTRPLASRTPTGSADSIGNTPAVVPARKSAVVQPPSDIWCSRQLRGLLSQQEYLRAEANTLNAHYTDPEIAASLWEALRDAGFAGGRVLEEVVPRSVELWWRSSCQAAITLSS